MRPPSPTVLTQYGFSSTTQLTRINNAVLTSVYSTEDDKILRGRPLQANTLTSFKTECELLDEARHLTTLHLPTYLHTTSSTPYVIDDDTLWTLHSRIPTRTLGDWRLIHEAPPEANKLLIQTMRSLHDASKGKLSKKFFNPYYALESTEGLTTYFKDTLPLTTIGALSQARNDIATFASHSASADAVFVHADFHHGNLLIDDRGKPSGLVDLDWAHAGHYLTDLGCSLMILIRDYKLWNPEPQLSRYLELARVYGVPDESIPLLCKHSLLFCLFESALFEKLPGYKKIFDYQLEYTKHFVAAVRSIIA